MNELCRFYHPHLSLYAEGELKDPYLAERIQAHLWCCEECQGWLDDYEDLTHAILASKSSPEIPLTVAATQELDRELDDGENDFDRNFDAGSTRSRNERVDHILSSVKRHAGLRRRSRTVARPVARRLAAAAIFLLATTVVVTFWHGTDEKSLSVTARRQPLVASSSASSRRATRVTPVTHVTKGWVLQNASHNAALDAKRPARVGLVRYVDGVRTRDLKTRTPNTSTQNTWPPGAWTFEARTEETFYHPSCDGWVFLVPERHDAAPGPQRDAIPVRLLSARPQGPDDFVGDSEALMAVGSGATPVFHLLFVPADPPRRSLQRPRVGAEEKLFRAQVPARLDPSQLVQRFSRSVEGVVPLRY